MGEEEGERVESAAEGGAGSVGERVGECGGVWEGEAPRERVAVGVTVPVGVAEGLCDLSSLSA